MGTFKRIMALILLAGWPGTAVPADRVVARVNGAPITEYQVEETVDRLIPRASFHGTLREDRLAAYREQATDMLIVVELKYQYALAKKMKPDQKAVKDRMQQVRDSFPSSREYKDWLKRAGRTESQLREMVERENLLGQARQSVVSAATMSMQQVREYYEQNAARFREPEAVRIRLISSKDRQKAEAALAAVSKKGTDFGAVAAKSSEDDFRIKGGDLGYVHRGRIFPALEEAAFKLKAGEIAGPIFTEGTWFVLKVEERRSERQIPFEETSEKLKNDLEKKRATDLENEWVASLRAQAKIEILSKTGQAPATDK